MTSPVPVVTIKTIAAAAEVSNPTVSRALRNDPRISLATRERVQAIARKLGYRPDPAMSALVAYRQRVRPAGDYGKLAVLNAWGLPQTKLPFYFRKQLEGIHERAGQLGYQAELFSMPKDVAAQKRLSRMLTARGIRGIIVGPVPVAGQELCLDWESFAAVAVGYSQFFPLLNYAASNHHHAVETVYGELRRLGYRKIGFHHALNSESRNRHLFLAAFLKCAFLDGVALADTPPLLPSPNDHTDPLVWLERHGFDAVICGYYESQELLKRLKNYGKSAPRDIGIAAICLDFDDSTTSGVREDLTGMGKLAVDQLHAQLIHGEHGIPTRRHSMLVEGVWCAGTTLRRAAIGV